MSDAQHQGYSIAEMLEPSRITRLAVSCEPAPEELEEFHRLFMNMDIRTCDRKTVDAYLKELGNMAHGLSKDGDESRASIFMLDSLGPLMEDHQIPEDVPVDTGKME